MSELSAVRYLKRYKLLFLLGFLLICIQTFLAYRSLQIVQLNSKNLGNVRPKVTKKYNSVANGETAKLVNLNTHVNRTLQPGVPPPIDPNTIGFQPSCPISEIQAISALKRAKTLECRKKIADIRCRLQRGELYPSRLPTHCPTGNYVAGRHLGCYRDEKQSRVLPGHYVILKTDNTPEKCIQLCLHSRFPYAGVQFGIECFCGEDEPKERRKLPDADCNVPCSGNPNVACGGHYALDVFETGIEKFRSVRAERVPPEDAVPVRVAFLLTLNGRALRQVQRLIKAIYSPKHFYYIHVDARRDYLYRELLNLEDTFPNIRLARHRFSSIWGGASLVSMLLHCMGDLYRSEWKWDFVMNLSESDFPLKVIDRIVEFLTANRDRNFLRGHKKETFNFISRQGMEKAFVECENRMWRIGDRVLPDGIQIYGGSDWIVLSRSFVEYLVKPEDDVMLAGMINYWQYSLMPGESFFHSVLRNSKFCGTHVDDNMHVVNWNRPMGCKCQHRHIVDWCGCSPNDLKPEDWPMIKATKNKALFFARKFEAIISQGLILKIEEWLFGPYSSDYLNLDAYWESLYHHQDQSPPDETALAISKSLMRLVGDENDFDPLDLKEITHFKRNDVYKGFILRYTALFRNTTIELETRIQPRHNWRVARNSVLSKCITNFEVSTDFDQKEQVGRNFAKFLGPTSEPVLVIHYSDLPLNQSYKLSVLWADPDGEVKDSDDLNIEYNELEAIQFSKSSLKRPLEPGIWTVSLVNDTHICAQSEFLVVPLGTERGKRSRKHRRETRTATTQNNVSFPKDWRQYFFVSKSTKRPKVAARLKSRKHDEDFYDSVDTLVSEFFSIRSTCSVQGADDEFENCKETDWSTLAPDPKSDIYSLSNSQQK